MSNNSTVHQTPHYQKNFNGVYNGQNGIQVTREVNSDKVRHIGGINEMKINVKFSNLSTKSFK